MRGACPLALSRDCFEVPYWAEGEVRAKVEDARQATMATKRSDDEDEDEHDDEGDDTDGDNDEAAATTRARMEKGLALNP